MIIDYKLGQLTGDTQVLNTWVRGCVIRHAEHPEAYLDVMSMDFSPILVTTIFVPVKLRRKGIATDLIKALQSFNKEIALSADPSVDILNSVSMEALHKLYTKLNFARMDDGTSYLCNPQGHPIYE